MAHTSRIILLIDMDCFYCQVEENLDPALKGKPLAVVQYNQWRGGGIIAVNYPARDQGVTRHMRGNEAKEKCPEIILARVPEIRGKADLSKYRDAGKRVADVLQTFTPYLERASVDEAYLDITSVVEKRIQENNDEVTVHKLPNSFVVGNSTSDFVENVNRHRHFDENNYKLAIGGVIAEEIREEVFKVTGYRCSAGVAHNKILAKLVCGLHKPNKQTIIPHESVPELYATMPIRKIKSLGGKFGNTVVEKLNIEHMGELSKFSQRELAKKFDEKSACWLYEIARGIDMEPVNTRLVSKSIGCCKKFPGRNSLFKKEDVEHWLGELAGEIFERLEKDLKENGRKARQMVVSFGQGHEDINGTKSLPLNSYAQKRIFETAYKIVQKNCLKEDGTYHVTFLGISVGNFQDIKKVNEITSFFKTMINNNNIKKEQALKGTVDSECPVLRQNTNEVLTKAEEINENNNIEKIEGSETVDEDTSDNSSIYSCTTEEGDAIATNNLIYYEQVHPESIANQSFISNDSHPIEIDKDSDVSHDSISGEVNFEDPTDKTRPELSVVPTHSFFTKYFSNNLNRNFNTSKTLDKVEVGDNSRDRDRDFINIDSSSSNDEIEEEIPSTESNGIYGTVENVNLDTEITVCSQCGKSITSADYQSHMDYHFAIGIVKNETHLYKVDVKSEVVSQSSSLPAKLGRKKKRRDCVSSAATNNKLKFIASKILDSDVDVVCDRDRKTITNVSGTAMEHDKESEEEIPQESNKLNPVVDDENVADGNLNISSGHTTCLQCGKNVNNEDYQSHMDYHVAISIVKNEAHLYKVEAKSESNSMMQSSSSPPKTGPKKRKECPGPAPANKKSIGFYFKKGVKEQQDDEEAKDLCGECHKQIPFSEWEVHHDFHAAKKLHLEMNGRPSKPAQTHPVKQKGVKTKFKGQTNILGFLKSS